VIDEELLSSDSFCNTTIFARLGNSVRIQNGVDFFQSRYIEIANNVSIDHGVCIGSAGGESIISNNRIYIEDQVQLGSDVKISSASQNNRIHIRKQVHLDCGVNIKAHDNGYIEIGEGTYIAPYTCLAGPGSIKIGKRCLIASHTGIYANNHIFADPTRYILEQGVTCKGIVIEDDCWLGTGVKVIDGVTIGQGSVIGAGAVVTKNIPSYSVAVGVPAKVIAQRDDKRFAFEKTLEQ
jgi:acetyltransferase-like isoleucine patch superfamily enzyme